MPAWRKFFRDKDGNVVVWQKPNLPLLVWLVARIAQWPLAGQWEHIVWLVGTAAILLWAILEITKGSSYFRRSFGAVVLVFTVLSLTK